jgi:serine/threonine protein kinase
MADPNAPQPGKPASTPPVAKPVYGATQSDAGVRAPPAQTPANDGAARYGATTADAGAATPAGGLPGAAANPYRIIALIGEGGMGQVHLAHDASLDRIVALKRIGREHVANERLRQRFFTEARSSSRLTHYHIVQVYRLDEDQDGPFIAMEYVAGPLLSRRSDWPPNVPNPPLDLEGLVKLQGPLKVADTIRLGRQLLSAVEYAHRNQIIHRDIKPANILLTAQWEPKLADFGLARQVNVADEGRTMAGAQLLTLGYGSPEQEIDASRADHRADLYAVAATLWFALTGQNPRFFRESEVPLELRAILVRGLEKDREKRFQSAAEFEQALEKTMGQVQAPVIAAAPKAAPDAVAVRCPKCGHAHAATAQALVQLKFCEQCGTVLQEPCRKCKHANGFWVKFCGSCGLYIDRSHQQLAEAKSAELSEAKSAELNEVSALVKQHEYRKALKMLDGLCALPQPTLAALVATAKRLLPQVEAGYDAAKKQRDEKLALARGHVGVCELEQAAQILAQVPAPLHNKEFTETRQSIEAELEKKGRLTQEIADRVRAKEYDGLLPKVERMIALDPNADYYPKLLTFLQEFERQAAKELLGYEAAKKQRDEKLALARRHVGVCDLEQAAQILAQVPAPLHNKEFTETRRSIEAELEKKGRLTKEITSRVQAKEYKGLLPIVERMIALDPNAEYYPKLLTFLQEFERQAEKEQLRQLIADRVQAKEYKGLLPKVKQIIALDPNADYRKLLIFLQKREKRAQLLRLGIISLSLNILGFIPPVSLAALGIGVFGAIKAHLRLTGAGEAAPISEQDRAAAEKARLLNVLGAGLGLCWLVGWCVFLFFRIAFKH